MQHLDCYLILIQYNTIKYSLKVIFIVVIGMISKIGTWEEELMNKPKAGKINICTSGCLRNQGKC